ncbi:MAG: hypothetical protein C5B59_18465 [Bacteroidetes bacterium]|nr:MAG: hypothetical protein C5B59_18465 [Bacteroidota bacterium]
MEVWIRFDNEGRPITDLYNLYCAAKDCEEEEINKSNELGKTRRLLHITEKYPKDRLVQW